MNNLTLYFKELDKGELSPKLEGMKELTKIRTETNRNTSYVHGLEDYW